MSADRLRYALLLALLSPLLVAYTLWEALRHRDLRYLLQRLGLGLPCGPFPIWLHAASVGEVNAALPLLEHLARRYPNTPLLLTTNTASGGQTALRRLPAAAQHAYLPWDLAPAVTRFAQRCRPAVGLIMETELWPNLFRICAARTIPLVIVNGRLSRRTLEAHPLLRRLYGQCLARVRAVLARSDWDRLAFQRLGATQGQVQTVGNIKFAGGCTAHPEALDLGRPYVLAASTRDGEEKLIAAAWRQAGLADHLLVIAPRHPKRRDTILAELAPLLRHIPLRSRGEAPWPASAVYLADTFGELGRLMAGADLVFMGGSLVPRGGHNILEPAALGKALLFGPHMDNFADEAKLLLEHDAAEQVPDEQVLGQRLKTLLGDGQRRRTLGNNARQVVEQRCDMAERYLAALEARCPELADVR